MKTINEIALQKEKEYNDSYIEWCKKNPGKIMNGLMSKAMGAKLASYCDTIEELNTLYKVFYRKGKDTEGPHGHFFATSAFTEIINEYNKQ